MWVWGALLVLAAGATGLTGSVEEEDACPAGCACSAVEEVDLRCILPNATVFISGQLGSSIQIQCDNENQGFTCEELPQLPYGQQQAVRLTVQYCAVPARLRCVAGRLGARGLAALYLRDARGGGRLAGGALAGLQLERLAIYGNDTMTIPREALSQTPSLRAFTINGAALTLRAGDFDMLPNLTYLELTAAKITSVPAGLFSSLTQLEKLYLWRNKIEELGDEQLQGLVSLQRLDVSDNPLRSLAPLARVAPPLRLLSARLTTVTELPPLTNLTQLERLEMMYNRKPLSLAPRALAALRNLTAVKLVGCSIQELPPDLLHDSSALKTLQLSSNKLTALPSGVFRDLAALEELDLSKNQIVALQRDIFSPLKALKRLNLENNKVVEFVPKLFSGLLSLRVLSASRNQLRRLRAPALAGLGALEELHLAGNQLTTPDDTDQQQYSLFEDPFSQLAQLRELDLSRNALRAAPAHLPRVAVFLRRLDLSHNQITELLDSDVSYTSNEVEVDVRHNRVATVWLDAAGEWGAAPAGRRGTVLLDDNPFQCDCNLYNLSTRLHGAVASYEAMLDVGEATCAGPAALVGARVASLPLAALTCPLPAPPCPAGCSCLVRPHTRTLELTCARAPDTYPNVTEMGGLALELALTAPPAALPRAVGLAALNMSGLALAALPAGALGPALRQLDLRRNRLQYVPSAIMEEGNATLLLADNPLACDCWHARHVDALQRHRARVGDYSRVTCATGEALGAVDAARLCGTWRAAAVGGTLAAVGLLAAAAALLLLRYRRQVRVWLYSRGLCARWLVIDDADRKYDAFVSFCHEDEEFVTRELVPALEAAPHHYALCVHYRDWTPGEWIPAQIARSVADSRRTIIVVSRKFLDSLWGRAEFRTANMSAVKEHRARVIVVLLEDVSSHHELDPELKAYLATNTYLKWGDPWFWDKLRYALPHRRPEAAARRLTRRLKKSALGRKPRKAAPPASAGALDTRLTADGVIINAAALVAPRHKTGDHVRLHLDTITQHKQKQQQHALDVALVKDKLDT